ncbi:MAG: hotdog family protein [Methylococcales bacterium]|nr:hotdog family protein [Methylococcales bacterium]
MMDFNNIDVAELIPHSGKMVLLDKIISCDNNSLSAELVVRDDGLLGNDKTVPAWAGIEYMAQAVAVYAGLMAKRAGEPVRLGFLLGTRRFKSNVVEYNVGSTLTVRVEKILQDGNLGAFECRIQGVDVEVRANLNVYQPPLNNH